MKILNFSYRKVTWWKRNSWILGGRHLPVNQGSLDISTSLINKHTNTVQANLFDSNTDDAAKTLDMTSWVSITFTRIGVGCQHFPQHSGRPSSKGSQSACGAEDSGEDALRKKIPTRLQHVNHEFTSQALQSLHSSHEEIFSCILFFLPPIFMGCTFCARSYASSRYKGKTCYHGA